MERRRERRPKNGAFVDNGICREQRESTCTSYLLCVQERGYTCTRVLYPFFPNVRNVLNIALVRVHVYPDNVPGVPERLKRRRCPGPCVTA